MGQFHIFAVFFDFFFQYGSFDFVYLPSLNPRLLRTYTLYTACICDYMHVQDARGGNDFLGMGRLNQYVRRGGRK